MELVVPFGHFVNGFVDMPAKKPAKKAVKKAPRKVVTRRPKAPSPVDVLKAEAAEANVLPLDYMLSVLNGPRPRREVDEPPESFHDRMARYEDRRMDAAKAAAPYVHAKPAAIVRVDTPPVEDRPVNVLELAKQVAFLFTLAQARPEVDVTPLRQLN